MLALIRRYILKTPLWGRIKLQLICYWCAVFDNAAVVTAISAMNEKGDRAHAY